MTQAISRRGLLHLIGATAGSSAAYQAALGLGFMSKAGAVARPQLAPPAKGAKRVLILGAGIAGLTAAYELNRAGYECTVLESSHRAGGRNLTLRHGDRVDEIGNPQVCRFDPDPDLFFNAGPARIPGHHTTLIEYCQELGVQLAPFINENRNAWVQDDVAFGGKPVRNREYVTDARGFLAEIATKFVMSPHVDGALSRDDAENLIECLRAFGDLSEANKYEGSSRAGLVSVDYTMPEQLKSVRAFPELLKSRLWQTVMQFGEGADQAAMMMEPVGGMDRIVDGFMAKVGHLVRRHARVESVMLKEKQVEVICNGPDGRQKLTADFCLNSIPFQLMAGIPNNFPAEYARVLSAIPRGKLLKVGFQMRERFWEKEQIFGGISWTTQDITQIWYPCHGIHRQKGIVLGAYATNDAQSERLENLDPAARLEAAIRQGEKVHPGNYRRHIEAGVSIPWHRMNHMLGCSARWSHESLKEHFARIQAPTGRHYMIGDQVSYHPGWQQGAMQSALLAIADIDKRTRLEKVTSTGVMA